MRLLFVVNVKLGGTNKTVIPLVENLSHKSDVFILVLNKDSIENANINASL